jgi:hypothetical protein
VRYLLPEPVRAAVLASGAYGAKDPAEDESKGPGGTAGVHASR